MAFSELKEFVLSFHFMREEDFNLIVPGLAYVEFNAKDHFCRTGSSSHHLGFVVQGAFRSYKVVGPKEVNTEFSFETDFIGDYASVANQTPSELNIQALESGRIISINSEVLFKAYDLSPNWIKLGGYMLKRAFFKERKRLEDLLLLDCQQRYLQLLATQHGMFERVPLYHIASYLGMEKESLSRLRSSISKSIKS